MIEGIFLATILVVAVLFAIRPWYRALIGKNTGCATCLGNCGHSCECSFHKTGEIGECEEGEFKLFRR